VLGKAAWAGVDDALSQAGELLDAGYKDPACVLIGVSLEIAVKELVERATLAPGNLDAMNTSLCKAGIYNMAKQKQNYCMGGIAEQCSARGLVGVHCC
jgi:hypothetical protein